MEGGYNIRCRALGSYFPEFEKGYRTSRVVAGVVPAPTKIVDRICVAWVGVAPLGLEREGAGLHYSLRMS